MILEFLCGLFFSLVRFLIGLLPRFPSFEPFNLSLSPLLSIVKFANYFIDIRVVAMGLIMMLIVYNIKFAWSIVMWIIRKIPGVS